jgi:hypothetical protein
MRVWAAQHLSVKHARDMDVIDVFRPAGNNIPGILPGLALPMNLYRDGILFYLVFYESHL